MTHRAHPRGCGADAAVQAKELSEQGSSPRVRGRRPEHPGRQESAGLIPAGAGQTPLLRGVPSSARAHPRGCGADDILDLLSALQEGSSPRVRGRPPMHGAPSAPRRLIPAGAGQTVLQRLRSFLGGAHPRGCGADFSLGRSTRSGLGSSPRVRGRHFSWDKGHDYPRLIPAGAGQTFRGSPSGWIGWAHPRGCGADLVGAANVYVARGSSPRVRGRQR